VNIAKVGSEVEGMIRMDQYGYPVEGVKEGVFRNGLSLVSLTWEEQIEVAGERPELFEDSQGLRR
jgi:hypothetical protein